MKIAFTGGGTSGHIMPIIAVARELKRLDPQGSFDFYYLGPKDQSSLLLLFQENIKLRPIFSGKLRRYFSFKNIVDIFFTIPAGFVQSLFLFLFNRPQLLFSKGGSGALSVTFAARILRIPVFIHESDIVPGLSNRAASKWAKKVFVAFPKTEYFDPAKVILVGNPI